MHSGITSHKRKLFTIMQWLRLAVGFGALAAGSEVGSLFMPIGGRIGYWVVMFATMFAVAGIADQIARHFFGRHL